MSETKDDGGPAFPVPFIEQVHDDGYREIVTAEERSCGGMSLRDYFAGQALAGMAASSQQMQACISVGALHERSGPEMAAQNAYLIADAMLAERSKP